MINVKLSCDKAINKKFKTYGIKKRKLENLLTLFVNDECATRKWWWYDIRVTGMKGTTSGYVWDSDKLEIALRAAYCNTQKERELYFVQSIVHEFCHWVQNRIMKVPSKALDYSDKDVDNRTENYLNNVHEIHARAWEDKVEGMMHFLK